MPFRFCNIFAELKSEFVALSRLRALLDLEGQLQAQDCELQSLREVQEQQGGGENLLQELEAQWKETQQAFSDR